MIARALLRDSCMTGCTRCISIYYASFSILVLVSIKHNFREVKYAWLEKWIHVGAFVPPLIFVVYAAKEHQFEEIMACKY